MLKLENVYKSYKMPTYEVKALKNVNLKFRKNEFVSILGPSGSGKTTLLNLIGGLDQYTSGDLIINGVSTKEFKDKDWDAYRNYKVGFVFQSYNLIPHQSVLRNVELALTISGVGKEEREKRAKEALDKVGLHDQYYKKPNQLSGGQSQRVAIARALVNDPDILLADEPTGALDTKTSKQIIDLIKEISEDRLVIMVTHNSELAEEYSTRIINLLDGEVIDDSNPLLEKEPKEEKVLKEDNEKLAKKPAKKSKKDKSRQTKMSFMTTFMLSLYNLFSKKSRTILTSIASSIGIIGISLVLSISLGLNKYIDHVQDDMLSGNPVLISKNSIDFMNMMENMGRPQRGTFVREAGYVHVNKMIEAITKQSQAMGNFMLENEITAEYIKYLEGIPEKDVATMFFDYQLDVSNNIYIDFHQNINEDPQKISLLGLREIALDILRQNEATKSYSNLASNLITDVSQAPANEQYLLDQYNVIASKNDNGDVIIPESDEEAVIAKQKHEIMLVVDRTGRLADFLLAQLGYFTTDEFVDEIMRIVDGGDNADDAAIQKKFSYEELMGKRFTWYPNDLVFEAQTHMPLSPFKYHVYEDEIEDYLNEGIELEIVAILEPKEEITYGTLRSGLFYTEELTKHIMETNKNSEIVQYITNITEEGQEYEIPSGFIGDKANPQPIGINYKYSYRYLDEERIDQIGFVGRQDPLLSMLGNIPGFPMANLDFYKLTRRDLGGEELPGEIQIYPKDLNSKERIVSYLKEWNEDKDIVVDGVTLSLEDRGKISHSDPLEVVFMMINETINFVTIALICFTSLSLLVSCVMIAIITYVSVVERVNEIGVIRSLGGRKRDVSYLFIAETFIIGLIAGLIAISVTYLGSWIINLIVHKILGGNIASFPIQYAVLMVASSVVLSLISGLIPSRSAAKKDPVDALRAE